MPEIKNVSPYGDLDVPLLHRTVKASEVVEVTAEQAKALLPQAENWQAVKNGAAPRKSTAAPKQAAPEPADDDKAGEAK